MDMTELQGLLSQFQPTAQDQAAANKQAFMALGMGLLGARRGFEMQQLGQAGLGALQAKQGYLQNAVKERQANLSQAATLSDMMRQSQFANDLVGGSRPTIGGPPSQPPAGMGPAAASPNMGGAPMQQSAPPQPSAPQPPASQPSPLSIVDQLREMGVPEVAIRTAAASKDPQGAVSALIKEYSQPVFGQGKIPLMRGPNGSFRAVVPQGFNEALASQTGAETNASEAAKSKYDLVDVPDGRGGSIKMPREMALKALGGAQPAAAAGPPKFNFNFQNLPPNEAMAVMKDMQNPTAGMSSEPSPYGQPNGMPQGQLGRTPSQPELHQQISDINTQAAQNTEVASAFGKDYVDMVKAEKSAPANIQKYNNLKSLYSQVSTGKLAGQVQGLKQIAAYVAPDLAQSWTKDVPYAQAATALSNAMALELRNPAGGAGMPGSLSDADRQYLQSMISSVQTDPRAIPMILNTKIALEQRNQDLGRIARDYRSQNGGKLDEGVYDAFQKYSDAHPLFKNMPQPAGASAEPDNNAIAAEMRRRGLLK